MCICSFPETCGGLGIVFCDGCGGDLCVCTCGGERDCDCEMCGQNLDGYGDDGDDSFDWPENEGSGCCKPNVPPNTGIEPPRDGG